MLVKSFVLFGGDVEVDWIYVVGGYEDGVLNGIWIVDVGVVLIVY